MKLDRESLYEHATRKLMPVLRRKLTTEELTMIDGILWDAAGEVADAYTATVGQKAVAGALNAQDGGDTQKESMSQGNRL